MLFVKSVCVKKREFKNTKVLFKNTNVLIELDFVLNTFLGKKQNV